MAAEKSNQAPSATTQPELEEETSAQAMHDVLALVIIWSAREPRRVGEVALFPPEQPQWILGRGMASAEVPGTEQGGEPVSFFRQRPPGALDRDEPTLASSCLQGEGISRRQLEIHPRHDGLVVINIGRCPLLVNQVPAQDALVRPGDTIFLRNQLLLYCTRRPLIMPALRAYAKERARSFGKPDLDGMVGESPAMWKLRESLATFAATNFHVLITGESGSGKELAAQAIHRMSSRAAHRLIADNIATIPSSLAAALLFGNRRNFPNPGMEERAGLIGAAHQSTLFLDEIGDMPEEVQPMFLRVTERGGEYFRLGEEQRQLRSDFRLIGATNRPQRLRHELKRRFQREVHVTGLNDRREDIPLLVDCILKLQAQRDDTGIARFMRDGQPQIHPLLIEQLIRHFYTTNVSEVSFLLGQAMAESPQDVISPRDLPPRHQSAPELVGTTEVTGKRESARSIPRSLPSRERAEQVLMEQGGDVTRSATILNISRDQLNRMIQREGLFVPKMRRPRRPSSDNEPR